MTRENSGHGQATGRVVGWVGRIPDWRSTCNKGGSQSIRLFEAFDRSIRVDFSGLSLTTTGIVAFVLLAVPTQLMGSTPPLLAQHFVRRMGNVGESEGIL